MPTDPPKTPMDSPDLQRLWQSQPTEYDPMTLAQIHHEAERLQARVRRRNLIEYAAGAVAMLFFLPVMVVGHGWMMRAGAGLVIAGMLFIFWRLSRVGPARSPVPSAAGAGAALVDFQRDELIRQRDALRGVGTWYLAPVLPGFALLLLGRWFGAPAAHRTVANDHLIIGLAGAISALVLLVIWLLNQRGADRLQKKIDEF